MISLAPYLAVVLLMLSAAGCVVIQSDGDSGHDWREEEQDNRSAISGMQIGMTRDEVQQKIGSPRDSESYRRGEDTMLVWFYRTHRTKADGETTRDEMTPLVFRDGVLIGWGEQVYLSSR
ncbi:DUF3192 domain-containing protein [Parahaliea aestuarii]|uniref:DUF3192 domain-containing protein n=1 Tax=Parahaliea aestuarii TaxID=1852021 RepID=A0A5C9A1R8_9GAMM|nr:DUF3192 domain-containing protein [Parahaliea aestuarii]TXS93577.1 DUF3192 domain-containing protein [Parahaliea aestuarii]